MKAKWKDGAYYSGQITEKYGRFVRFQFDDGYWRWVETSEVDPPQAPGPEKPENNPFKIGAEVMALWDNNQRFPGKIDGTYGKLAHIQYDDGDTGWAETSAVTLMSEVTAAPWGQKKQMFPVTVVEIYGGAACVRFENGFSKWLGVEEIQPPPVSSQAPNEACPLKTGQSVYARWDNGKFYPGKVAKEYGKLVFIDFNDGDSGWALAADCHVK